MPVLLLVAGVSLIVVAVLGATGRLPTNGFVGMRTKATLASDAAWDAAHRASAWSPFAAGVACVGGAAWLQLTHAADGDVTTPIQSVVTLVVLGLVLAGGFHADRVAKAHARTGTRPEADRRREP